MTELETLKQQAGRYKRLSENKDFKDTMKDMSNDYSLDESVMRACNSPNASEYLFAKGGIRTLHHRLLTLADEFEERVKNYQEPKEDGDEI